MSNNNLDKKESSFTKEEQDLLLEILSDLKKSKANIINPINKIKASSYIVSDSENLDLQNNEEILENNSEEENILEKKDESETMNLDPEIIFTDEDKELFNETINDEHHENNDNQTDDKAYSTSNMYSKAAWMDLSLFLMKFQDSINDANTKEYEEDNPYPLLISNISATLRVHIQRKKNTDRILIRFPNNKEVITDPHNGNYLSEIEFEMKVIPKVRNKKNKNKNEEE